MGGAAREQPGGEARRTFPFAHSRVRDAMASPIRTCAPSLPLAAAVELIAGERVHSLAVVEPAAAEGGEGRLVGIVTDLDLLAAAIEGASEGLTVGDVAADPALTIGADEPLPEAATLMLERGARHVVVVDPATAQPVGIVSTLDLLRAIAWGQPPAPA
jgi:CBS domain-containing protein